MNFVVFFKYVYYLAVQHLSPCVRCGWGVMLTPNTLLVPRSKIE